MVFSTIASKSSTSSKVLSALKKKDSCTQFIAEAGSQIYKVCQQPSCTSCVAIKVPKNKHVDVGESIVHENITHSLEGTSAEPHFNKFIKLIPGPRPILVQEYEENVQGYKTIAQLLQSQNVTSKLWKVFNFQILKALYTAQLTIPGFQHNDTHTENILVVKNETNHVCSVISPSGKQLVNYCDVLIKIIDFGQTMATSPNFCSPEGETWRELGLLGNKMIDFHRFVVWAIMDISFHEGKTNYVPVWYKEWIEFVTRWVDIRLLPDFTNSTIKEKIEYISIKQVPGGDVPFIPTLKGSDLLNRLYGPQSVRGLGNMLDDPYFNEFVSEITYFEDNTKLKSKR